MEKCSRRRSRVKTSHATVIYIKRPFIVDTSSMCTNSFYRDGSTISEFRKRSETGTFSDSSEKSSAVSYKSTDRVIKTARANNEPDSLTKRQLSSKHIEVEQLQESLPQKRISPISNNLCTKKNNNKYFQRNCTTDQQEETKRRHRRRCGGFWCCCPCSCLCAAISAIAAVLLSAVIAAIILLILLKPKTTTTTSTTTTTTTTTSTTTTTTTSTTTTTTTTETTTTQTFSIGSNDILEGVWDADAGGDSQLSTPGHNAGNYIPNENPRNAFDGTSDNKYINFGYCNDRAPLSHTCGVKTGFHVTLYHGAMVVKAFRLCAGNDFPARDPMIVTVEGSNQTGTSLFSGSVWSLIYNGTSGLDPDPGRNMFGQMAMFSSNTVAYRSYRFLVVSKRDEDYAMQIGDLQLFN